MIGRVLALIGVLAHCWYPLWAVPALPSAGRAALGAAFAIAFVLAGAWLERRLADPPPAVSAAAPPALWMALGATALLHLWPATWPLLSSSDEHYHAFIAVPATGLVCALGGRPGAILAGFVLVGAALSLRHLARPGRPPWRAWAWVALLTVGAAIPIAGADVGALVSERATEHIYRFPALAKPVSLTCLLVLGVSESAARLPSIAGHLATAFYVHRLLAEGGEERLALPAALLLLLMPAPFFFGHIAFLDSAGLGFSAAALAAYVRHLRAPSAAGLPTVALIGGAGFLYRPTVLLVLLVVGFLEILRAVRRRRFPEGAVEALVVTALLVAPFLVLHKVVAGRGHAAEWSNLLRPARLFYMAGQAPWTAGLGVVLAPIGLAVARRSVAGGVVATWGLANYAMIATAWQWQESRLYLPFFACTAVWIAAAVDLLPGRRAWLAAALAAEVLALIVPMGRGGMYTWTEGRWFLRFPYREALAGLPAAAGPVPAVSHPFVATPHHFYAHLAGTPLDGWRAGEWAPPAEQTLDGLVERMRTEGSRFLLLPNRLQGFPGEFEGYRATLNADVHAAILSGRDPRFCEVARWAHGPNDLILYEVRD